MKKYKWIILTIVLFLFMLILTGCTSDKIENTIDLGYTIDDLTYDDYQVFEDKYEELAIEVVSLDPEITIDDLAVVSLDPEIITVEGKYNHDEYQQKIEKIAKDYGSDAVSVALIENGKVIDTFAYGSAIKGELPMTADTKVRIASISKVFLGIATMISVENGTMSLDEDIGTYWGFKLGTHANGDVITPRSILTHTSSIYDSNDVSVTNYSAMAYRLRSGIGIRNIVSGNIENYYYNNYAMNVLGMTIELANHKTIDDILSERLFSPLGIDAAFYPGDVRDTANIATIYQEDGSVGMPASRMKSWHKGKWGSIGWSFSGGLTIDVKDLGKMIALLSNNGVYEGIRYLSEETIKNLEYHYGSKTKKYWQCQPWYYETNRFGQKKFYYHDGRAYGVLSLAGYNPETKQGIAILTTGAAHRNDICGDITTLLLNMEV